MPTPFQSTPWSLVLQAADPASPDGREALGQLFELCWRPLYGYLRRTGYDAHQAEELTQGFFARVVEKKTLAGLAEGRGRFRNFLLVCLKRYVANQHEHQAAEKRGGRDVTLSLDFPSPAADWGEAESRYRSEPADRRTPEQDFQRRWALATLERAIAEVGHSWEEVGKAQQFQALSPYLTGDSLAPTHAATAEQMGVTVGVVKTAVHRLRAQFRETLCRQVGETLDRPELLDDELRQLFSALRV